jgi:hypothetical protein
VSALCIIGGFLLYLFIGTILDVWFLEDKETNVQKFCIIFWPIFLVVVAGFFIGFVIKDFLSDTKNKKMNNKR